MDNLIKYLEELGINYQSVNHSPVFTVEQANNLVPYLPGAHTKNLFLRDKKGRRHFLLSCLDYKTVNLHSLAMRIGVSKLSLASTERLRQYLCIEPGSVSILALYNDREGHVELLLDKDLWGVDIIQAHPIVNTTTLAISRQDLERFILATNHTIRLVEV